MEGYKTWRASIAFALTLILVMSSFYALADSFKPYSSRPVGVRHANTLSPVGTAGVPAKIAVTCTPPKVLADNSYYYYAIKVELQDLYGNPAYAPEGGIGVSVSSSDPIVGYASSPYCTVGAGETYQTLHFRSTYQAGSTTIKAQAVGLVSGSATMTTVGATPYKVQVILAPNKVLADDEYCYYPVCVQLQDSLGNPAFAPSSVYVGLSSSVTSVGTVQAGVTINAGETFARAWFKSTLVPGTTTIKATAVGLVSTSATMTTVAAGADPAKKLRVYLAPSVLPADGATEYYPVVVGLEDDSGRPVEASSSITVSLSSLNTTVGTVPGTLTISTGEEFGEEWFKSTYVPGKATVKAEYLGLSSSTKDMITIGYTPTRYAVYLGPSKVFAHKKYSYYLVVVQAQDGNGNPARAPTGGLTATMTSSSTPIGTTSGTVSINAGETHGYTHFYSTYKPGQTTITASGTLTAGSSVIKTVAPVPSKLGMDLALSKVFAINGKYYSYIVRIILQDSAGNPALAPAGGITVTLTSSATSCGTVQSPVTISEGEFFTYAWFRSTNVAGSTTITASASIGGSTKMASQLMTTISPTANAPVSLKVKVLPKILSLAQTYYYPVAVYLVDASGDPAKAPTGGISVSLSSSDSLVGEIPTSITISSGEIDSYTWFRSTWRPGTTTITAVAPDLTSGSALVTTGAFPPISKTYTFKNLDYLFYSNTLIVVGDSAHSREAMAAALMPYALSQVGAKKPLVKTDGLITSTEYSKSNLILIGYNNTKTAAKNTAYGIVVNQNLQWFNITTTEGLKLDLSKAEYPSKSIAIVYLKKDGTRTVMLAWGYGWPGTYAACLFMSDTTNWLKPAVATKHLLMLTWADANANGFVEDVEVTVVSSA